MSTSPMRVTSYSTRRPTYSFSKRSKTSSTPRWRRSNNISSPSEESRAGAGAVESHTLAVPNHGVQATAYSLRYATLRCGFQPRLTPSVRRQTIVAGEYQNKGGKRRATMASIAQLGYLGLGVADLPAWERFATGVLGLAVDARGSDETLYLRMDEYSYRLAVHPDRSDDILYVGWEAADAQALRAIAEQISAAGVTVREGSPEEAK